MALGFGGVFYYQWYSSDFPELTTLLVFLVVSVRIALLAMTVALDCSFKTSQPARKGMNWWND